MADPNPRAAAVTPPAENVIEAPETAIAPDERRDQQLVEADYLVEDVSIDGMCGVY